MVGDSGGDQGKTEDTGRTGKVARTFEELHVYQRARELTNAVYRLTRTPAFRSDFGLADQVRRAAVSVMSNIAEGFERGSKAEFIQFLYIAKGSSGEVRAQLQVATDQNYLGAEEGRQLQEQARQVSGMIGNFLTRLEASDYRGEKFARKDRQAVQTQTARIETLRRHQRANIEAGKKRGAGDGEGGVKGEKG